MQIFPLPCLLAATMTSAEGSKNTCWMNTFNGSKWSEVGPIQLFHFLDVHGVCGLARPRFYKILTGPVHVPHIHHKNVEAVWAHFTLLWEGFQKKHVFYPHFVDKGAGRPMWISMYINKMKKWYGPTSLQLEPSNVFIQQLE